MSKVIIALKPVDDPKNIEISNLEDDEAQTIFDDLLLKWETHKVLKVPTHKLAIATDCILGIVIE